MTDENYAIMREIETLQRQNAELSESVAQQLLTIEDVGWTRLGDIDADTGPSLDLLHSVAEDLQDMTATNPLFLRGAQLRHAYVFGRGVTYSGVDQPRFQKVMNDPYNQTALFSPDAYATCNMAMFAEGNLFVLRSANRREFTVVPQGQITGVVTHPDDTQRIRYLKRTWSTVDPSTGKTQDTTRWYPLARYASSGARLASTIGGVPVAKNQVMYHKAGNRLPGWTFGVPDSLAAKIWAMMYSGYLKDNATLVKAYSQIAWKYSVNTKKGGDAAAARVSQPGGTGGTAIIGNGNDLTPVNRSGSVDFGNGQPLAAMVASAFGVPVIALLSSPGASGGSYGAAQTLDGPTIKVMTALQESWKGFFEEILHDLGAAKAQVDFASIEQDATYREINSILNSYKEGAIYQDEMRDAVLDLLEVQRRHDNPPPSTSGGSGTSSGSNRVDTPEPGLQGGSEQGVTNHDADNE